MSSGLNGPETLRNLADNWQALEVVGRTLPPGLARPDLAQRWQAIRIDLDRLYFETVTLEQSCWPEERPRLDTRATA